MQLLDAGAPALPTVTIPPGAPWWAYVLGTVAPVALWGLWVLHKHLEREAEARERTATHEVRCADCTAARADVAALRAEIGAALQKQHAGIKQITELQMADSKVLEGLADSVTEHGKQLTAIDKTVTLIDRDSFRREPTR